MDGLDWVLWLVVSFVVLIVVSAGAGIIYDVKYLQPERDAWAAACTAEGGTPIPTRMWSGAKTGVQYGDYICAKIETLPVPVGVAP